MSKIVCQVCGTYYPDTAEQCPICGAAQKKAAQAPAGGKGGQGASASGKKGAKPGYFTKSNVKKRTTAAQKKSVAVSRNAHEPKVRVQGEDGKKRSHVGVIILVLLLLLLAVAAWIFVEYILPNVKGADTPVTDPSASNTSEALPSTSESTAVACTGITVSKTQVTLSNRGDMAILDAKPQPDGVADPLIFTSADEKVAVVDENGAITAMGNGETDIVISCGGQTVVCRVKCSFPEATTETTKPTSPTETTAYTGEFELDRYDITFAFKGETYELSVEGLDNKKIAWTSDDPNVVTVKDGLVRAVHSGTATVTASYGGKTDSCIFRCNFPDEEDVGGGENQSSGGNAGNNEDKPAQYIISHIDVTLYVGYSFGLYLNDQDGNAMDVSWYSNNSSVASVSGNEVTGVSGGMTTVCCDYEGKTYQCIVRVYTES